MNGAGSDEDTNVGQSTGGLEISGGRVYLEPPIIVELRFAGGLTSARL